MTKNMNVPLIFVALVLSAALFVFLTLHHDANPQASTLGFMAAAVALFLKATKATPDEGDTFPAPGVSPRGRGVTSSVTPEDDGLKLKKELLLKYALNGEHIDDAHEFQAEMTAQDIVARSKAWKEWPTPAPVEATKNPKNPKQDSPPTSADQSVKQSENK